MNIWLYRKMIYRHNTPSDRELHQHIIKMERKFVGQMIVPNHMLPQVGDVYYIQNIPYEIKRRIFVSKANGAEIHDCVCEVVIYNASYTTSYGSDSWTEMIPLVTEMPDEVPDEIPVAALRPVEEGELNVE